MKRVADADDRWFISEVVLPYVGWLSPEVSEWLRPRVRRSARAA